MILINENRMRQNDGLPELTELPDEMRLEDNLGEFAEEPNEAEKEAYEKLGLVRMRPVKKKKKPGKPKADAEDVNTDGEANG